MSSFSFNEKQYSTNLWSKNGTLHSTEVAIDALSAKDNMLFGRKFSKSASSLFTCKPDFPGGGDQYMRNNWGINDPSGDYPHIKVFRTSESFFPNIDRIDIIKE